MKSTVPVAFLLCMPCCSSCLFDLQCSLACLRFCKSSFCFPFLHHRFFKPD